MKSAWSMGAGAEEHRFKQTGVMESSSTAWTAADLPRLAGRNVIVTGANSGLGYHTASALAACGADVTMAVRNLDKGEAAARDIRTLHPDAGLEVSELDLADLTSIRAFAERWSAAHVGGLSILVNNAGIMAIPRRETADAFEMQLGTNHLGHFALTGLLLPALIAQPGARVVTVSSQAHRLGKMDFDDLMGRHRYRTWGAYGQSKLANLLFTTELQHRIDDAGLSLLALAAHPGYANTNLQSAGPTMRGSSIGARMSRVANNVLAQSAEMGALPTLYAATMPGLPGDTYIVPDGFMEQRGHPRIVGRSTAALRAEDGKRLWAMSEELTGVRYPFD